MPTRLQNLYRIRDLLGRPWPDSPSFHDLMRQEISEEMDIVNATLESRMPWATETYQLNYSPNQDSYAINVTNWGKVMYVVREVPGPYIRWVNVPFDDLNNQHYGVVWQNYYGILGGGFPWQETPERMSFYREGVLNAQYMVKIQPMPQMACTYQLTYIPGYIGVNDPLESSIQMPEHAELVRLRAATALLPYSKWFEDEAMNSGRRKELAEAFVYQLQRKETLFANYIRNINLPKTISVSDWND